MAHLVKDGFVEFTTNEIIHCSPKQLREISDTVRKEVTAEPDMILETGPSESGVLSEIGEMLQEELSFLCRLLTHSAGAVDSLIEDKF